ncbi:MAG: hypothetical protein K0R25_881 [Rickettsiaceae bacterium]|jgi:hypothetical protein|nr:hypothetical protein [Rickettsiaceae bacterium]
MSAATQKPDMGAILTSISQNALSSDKSFAHEPVGHAGNVDTSWGTPVFKEGLEPFPGARHGSLDSLFSLGSIGDGEGGILNSIKNHSAFEISLDLGNIGPATIGNMNEFGEALIGAGDTNIGNIGFGKQTNLGQAGMLGKGGGQGH